MDKVLMKGNEAIAEAAIRANCKHFFGYPITPQTEISAYMAKKMPKIGGTFMQAESEVAAINMVYGAAGAGVRVMTSSSSPGVSLKQEGISYIAVALHLTHQSELAYLSYVLDLVSITYHREQLPYNDLSHYQLLLEPHHLEPHSTL